MPLAAAGSAYMMAQRSAVLSPVCIPPQGWRNEMWLRSRAVDAASCDGAAGS